MNDGKRISKDEMQRQQKYYKTSKEYCHCSENKLLSSQLSIDLPCIHRLNLADPPEITKDINIKLTMKNQWENLQVKYTPIINKSPKLTIEEQDKLYVKSTVKFYSKYKGSEIDEYVDKNYSIHSHNDGFILNKPTYLFTLISDGIEYGKSLKKAKKKNKLQ